MASIFENYPLELLEMIFQHLRRQPYSFYSLALTCRKFYIITTPTLYSSICLTNPASSEKLARTLQQNSWLSSLVLELQVHFHPPQTDQTHDTLLDAIVQMPNLESLVLRSVSLEGILEPKNHRLLSKLVRDKDNVQIESPTQYVGQRLRSLYLGAAFTRYHRDGWLLDANEVVFYMEQLEKLHIQGAHIENLRPDLFAAILPSRKTALQDLSLLNCNILPDTLGQILVFPDGLTRFTMKGSWPDPGGRFTSWEYSHIVYPHQYIEKLKESSSAGLEYLDLDLWYPESLPDYDSLDGLKHLGILVPSLHVYEEVGVNELSAAVPIPSLPASLETLTLHGFKPVSISFGSLVEMVEAGQLPNLRAVTYQKLYGQDQEETGEQTEEYWQNDIKSLRKSGVELSIASRPGSSIILPENDNWPCQCWIFDLEMAWW